MSNNNGSPYGMGYYQSKKLKADNEREKSATNELLSDISDNLNDISRTMSAILDKLEKNQ